MYLFLQKHFDHPSPHGNLSLQSSTHLGLQLGYLPSIAKMLAHLHSYTLFFSLLALGFLVSQSTLASYVPAEYVSRLTPSPEQPLRLAKRKSDPKLQLSAKCHTDEGLNLPVLGSVRFKYTVTLTNYEKTGYCGKGLLDNLHTHCRGEWPQNWDCKDTGKDTITASFEMPKINIKNCIEDAVRDASDGRVSLHCEGVDALKSTIGTGFSVGMMAVPGPGGVAGKVATTVGKEVAEQGIKAGTQGTQSDQKGGGGGGGSPRGGGGAPQKAMKGGGGGDQQRKNGRGK